MISGVKLLFTDPKVSKAVTLYSWLILGTIFAVNGEVDRLQVWMVSSYMVFTAVLNWFSRADDHSLFIKRLSLFANTIILAWSVGIIGLSLFHYFTGKDGDLVKGAVVVNIGCDVALLLITSRTES